MLQKNTLRGFFTVCNLYIVYNKNRKRWKFILNEWIFSFRNLLKKNPGQKFHFQP